MRLPEVAPITRLFGGAILRTDARALELAGELSASLEGADPAQGAIDLDAALAEILEGLAAAPRVSALAAEKERLDALLKASNEENAALLNQLISAQEALDAEARARRAAEKRVETLDRQLDEEQNAKRAATNRAEDLKRQLTEAKKERQAAEKRVVTLDRQLDAGQKAKEAAEANSRALNAEIDRILNSYSFRVTAPIRWVRRIASGQWKQ
jgi:chromosome segregation ATPase